MISIHKKILILSVSMLLIIACGCARAPQISRIDSADNFSKYEKIIQMVSNKYNLSMREINDPNYDDENYIYKDFIISGTDLEISFYLSNEALDTEEKAEETFLIVYNIPENKDFDLELFTELVNSISGKTISTEFCENFLDNLNVSENISQDPGILLYKSKPLDFEPNWVISYTLEETEYPDDYSQKLEFVGLTISGLA